ncbi:MAG: hypothetical protein ACYS47_12880 [Planctomycetota bacterium]|jgi:hypothetical protein
MKNIRPAIAFGLLAVLAGLALAASSFNYRSHPMVMDQGGEPASSVGYQQYGSIGGMALGGTSASTNHTHAATFIPNLFPGAPLQPAALLLAPGSSNPPNTNESAGASDVPALQLSLSASPRVDIEIQSVTVTASGTGDDQNDVTGVRLFTDRNQDGVVDAGDVLIAGVATGFPADNGSLVFGGLSEILPAGTTQYWLAVLDLSAAAPVGATFSISLAGNGDVTAVESPAATPVNPTGAPVSGGVKTVAGGASSGSLRVFTVARAPDAVHPLPGALSVEAFPFGLGASSLEDMAVTKIRVTASGTGDDGADVSAARLFRDADSDGKLGAGDVEVGSATFPADDGAAEFSGLTETVPAGGALRLLVVYDMAGTEQPGQSFGCLISKSPDVEATGAVSSLAVRTSGTPIGAMFTIRAPLPPPPTETDGCGCLPPAGGGSGGHLPAFLLLAFSLLCLRARRLKA